MSFIADPLVTDKVSNAICISGIARSGTTIMGRLIHSLKNVEYAFEPTMLMHLFLLADHMPEKSWRVLYQSCLYQQILMDSIAGRSLNFNSNDDSYIFKSKSIAEIASRFDGENRFNTIFERTRNSHVAYKLPNIVPLLPKLRERYPDSRIMIMLRSPDAVVLSLKRKGWFRREVPLFSESGLLKKVGDHTVPAVVDDSLVEQWMTLGETDRCYLFYQHIYRDLTRTKDALVVDYSRFVEAPKQIFGGIMDRFGLEYGEQTEAILDGTSERYAEYPVPPDASAEQRDAAWKVYEEGKSLAL